MRGVRSVCFRSGECLDGCDTHEILHGWASWPLTLLSAFSAAWPRVLGMSKREIEDIAHAVILDRANRGSVVRQLTPWDLNADTADLSQATSGPTKDLVVFESYGHGDPPPGSAGDIETVPTTCSSVAACTPLIRNLTKNGDGPADSNNPAWSPDGSHIAFVEYVHPLTSSGGSFADIYTMTASGREQHRVSNSQTWTFRPDW